MYFKTELTVTCVTYQNECAIKTNRDICGDKHEERLFTYTC